MLEDFDKQVSIWSESFARRFNRRTMVGSTVKGLFATVAAVTVGQLTNFGNAFAATTCVCDRDWTAGNRCDAYGYPCPHKTSPNNGCPTGCSICTTANGGCSGFCNWSSGHWVSCSNLGSSHKGYKLCWDCKCGTCKHVCSCLSGCINC